MFFFEPWAWHNIIYPCLAIIEPELIRQRWKGIIVAWRYNIYQSCKNIHSHQTFTFNHSKEMQQKFLFECKMSFFRGIMWLLLLLHCFSVKVVYFQGQLLDIFYRGLIISYPNESADILKISTSTSILDPNRHGYPNVGDGIPKSSRAVHLCILW